MYIKTRQSFVIVITALFASCILGMGVAIAEPSRIYFAGYLGLSHFGNQDFSDGESGTSGHIKTKKAPNFAGALGLRLNDNIRLEGEVSYRKTGISGLEIDNAGSFQAGGDLKSWTGLLNVYYDFNTHSKFTPYLSGGLGFSHVAGDFSGGGGTGSFNDEAYGLAWQAGAGLKYRPDDDIAYTLGYRYLDTVGLEMNGVDLDHSGHEFRVGLEYDLNWR